MIINNSNLSIDNHLLGDDKIKYQHLKAYFKNKPWVKVYFNILLRL